MKKFTSLLLIAVCVFTSVLFAACGSNQINMSRYFSSNVKASIYSQETTSSPLTLDKITGSTAYQTKKYTQTVLTADNNWFNGMYIETVSFYIYSTETKEVEFDFTLTGMKVGKDSLLSSATTDFNKFQIPCHLKANEGVRVVVAVNDTVNLSTSNSKLTIQPSDPYTVFLNNNFEYCIYGLQIIGYHN